MVNITQRFFRRVFERSIKMFQYEKIDVSKGIDVDKSNKSNKSASFVNIKKRSGSNRVTVLIFVWLVKHFLD